jgi:tetratricopeptide (TPR) repeat protein
MIGRFDEALEEAKIAQRLDPLSLIIGTVYASIAHNAMGFEEAKLAFERVFEQDPDFEVAWRIYSVACATEGLYDESVAAMLRYLELFGARPDVIEALRESHARGGWEAFCRTQIDLLHQAGPAENIFPTWLATAYAYLNEPDSAFHYLEVAYRERLLAFIKAWPPFHRFESDPRYADLLRRMNLPQ